MPGAQSCLALSTLPPPPPSPPSLPPPRTLLDEHLQVKGRTTWYEAVEEMQQDLEVYLEIYNRKCPHRGRAMEGRTPYTVFKAGLKDAKKAAKAREEEANKKAA